MKKEIVASRITGFIKEEFRLLGDPSGIIITNVKPVNEADESSLVWIDPDRKDSHQLALQTRAKLIISGESLEITDELKDSRCFIIVKRPKLTYIRIVANFFTTKTEFGIHSTAFVHPEAQIHPQSYIGPFTYVGKATVGKNSIIEGHAHIYDNVNIGENVRIFAGCVIGSEGFNLAQTEEMEWLEFPHIGGVEIEDNVTIHAMTHIDRGTLGNTVIGKGSRIDNAVHIAHNVKLGPNNVIIAHCLIAGSVVTGENCWLGPSTVVRDGIKLGNNIFSGMGSLIVNSLPDNARVMGSPARPIEEYKKLLQKMKGD